MADRKFEFSNVASNYENMKKILGDPSVSDSIAGILHNIDEDMKNHVDVVDMAIYGDLGKQMLLNWENTSSTFGSFINNFDNWNKAVAMASGNYAEFVNKVQGLRDTNPLGMTSGGITEAYTNTGYYSGYDQELVDTAASYIGPFVAYNGLGYFDTGSVAFEEQRKTNAMWSFGLNAVSTILSVVGLKGVGGAANFVDDAGNLALNSGDDILRLTSGAGDDVLRLTSGAGDDVLRLTSGAGDDILRTAANSGDDILLLTADGGDDVLRLTTGANPTGNATSFVMKAPDGSIVFGPGFSDDVLRAAANGGDDVLRLTTGANPTGNATSFIMKASDGSIVFGPGFSDDVLRAAANGGDDVLRLTTGTNPTGNAASFVDDFTDDVIKYTGDIDVLGADGSYIGTINSNGKFSYLKTFINKSNNAGAAAADWIKTHGSSAAQWIRDTSSNVGAAIRTNAGKIPGYISDVAQNAGGMTTAIIKNAAGTPGTGTIVSSYIPRVLEENVLSDNALANTIVSQSVYAPATEMEE